MMFVGTAGWSISKLYAEHFPDTGTSLERYATVFNCTEINSSFYRPHRADTWQRWADSVPEHFRFSVKAPRTVTHEHRLIGAASLVEAFLSALTPLGAKLGPILFQLPPSLKFDAEQADRFFADLRDRYQDVAVIEPRHSSWASGEADDVLNRHGVTAVMADPPKVAMASTASPEILYLRLHGSPKVYYSSYEPDDLDRYAALAADTHSAQSWCIFDNTASGAALTNALDMQKRTGIADLKHKTSRPG